MKIFIDFDDVILNANKLKEDFLKDFKKFGIDRNFFFESYENSKKDKGEFQVYNTRTHVNLMSKKSGVNVALLDKIFWERVKKSSKYIFSDVIPFLNKFKKEDLYLISYGGSKYQKTKIGSSGVKKYFKKSLVVTRPKSEVIKLILKNINQKEKIFFIDDRVKFITDVKKKKPKIKTFLMRRRGGRFRDEKNKYCNFVVNDFKEAEKIIKLNNGK
jgi:FMN phosphatase YigB (HAD superfamily)